MKRKSWMGRALLAGILAVSCAISASAACVGVGTVNGDGLRLRSGAGIGYSVLDSAAKDAVVVVLEEVDGWYKVDYGTQVGYMSAGYVDVATSAEADLGLGMVTTKGDPLNLRSGPSTDQAVAAKLPNGALVSVGGLTDGWYKVIYNETTGYVSSDYITLVQDENGTRKDGQNVAVNDLSGSALGQRIVEEARKHIGKRYVSGGKGPNAFDCSGFAYYVTKQASGGAIVLSGGSSTQWRTAPGQRIYSISELQPGDLFFICDPAYSAGYPTSHVAIYAGNGQLIHAADHRTGVVINPIKDKDYRYFVGAIRLG